MLLGEIQTRHKLQGEIVGLKQDEQSLSEIHLVSCKGKQLSNISLSLDFVITLGLNLGTNIKYPL